MTEFDASPIAGSEAVVAIFGYWPSFHDAEVLALRIDRDGVSGSAELEADVHVFEMTSAVTPDGFYELRHHTRVTLLFEGIDELTLEGFNHQNALMGLSIENIADRQLELLRWEVSFDAAYGLDATFLCSRVRVAAAEPYSPHTRPASYGSQGRPRPAP
jgi:hypothetical protein